MPTAYNVGENSGHSGSNKMAGDIGKLLKSPVFWLRILELLLIFLMIALTVNGGYHGRPMGLTAWMSRSFIVFGTMYAYVILNLVIIIGHVMGEPISKKIVLMLVGGGAILFVTAGAIEIEYWDQAPKILPVSDLTLGAGILGIIIGAIYLVDTALTFKFSD